MSARRTKVRTIRLVAMIVASCLLTVPAAASGAAAPGAAASVSTAEITGSGSSWAYNAVQAWISNVQSQGLQVVFTPSGSAAGRTDFALHTTDFAVSDIGYQGQINGQNDTSSRPYAYLPITAGGTAFPYNIVVGGRRITNLRLSGQTLAEIFTNHITNWADPAITHDNNGRQLPSLPIITVVHSEGSGTTAMFTRYLNYEFPGLWRAFNNGQGGLTEFWPRQGTNQIGQDGSDQVMNYLRSSAANGAIGMDEYSYALLIGYPVVQVENAAGYYVLPSEYNDAVALTKAVINNNKSSPDYLLQNLDHVYNYNDPRAYPLSSYSYTIMPTSRTDPRMAVPAGQFPAKWQALADFLSYSICAGQEYIGPIGYSALPVNLVQAGFDQIKKIKAAAPQVQISQLNILNCHNPTFVFGNPYANHLALVAPYPPQCDKSGYGPCVGVLNANANNGNGSTGSHGGAPPASTSSGHGGGPSASASAAARSRRGKGGTGVNPATGLTTGTTATANAAAVNPVTTNVPPGLSGNMKVLLAALAVLLLVIALITPPLVRRGSFRRRQP
jgi:phosphate transport system substrate-binding protein